MYSNINTYPRGMDSSAGCNGIIIFMALACGVFWRPVAHCLGPHLTRVIADEWFQRSARARGTHLITTVSDFAEVAKDNDGGIGSFRPAQSAATCSKKRSPLISECHTPVAWWTFPLGFTTSCNIHISFTIRDLLF